MLAQEIILQWHGSMTVCQPNVFSFGTEVKEETETGFKMRKVVLKHAYPHLEPRNVTLKSI